MVNLQSTIHYDSILHLSLLCLQLFAGKKKCSPSCLIIGTTIQIHAEKNSTKGDHLWKCSKPSDLSPLYSLWLVDTLPFAYRPGLYSYLMMFMHSTLVSLTSWQSVGHSPYQALMHFLYIMYHSLSSLKMEAISETHHLPC